MVVQGKNAELVSVNEQVTQLFGIPAEFAKGFNDNVYQVVVKKVFDNFESKLKEANERCLTA